jgi:hypothetical protein
MTSYPVRSMPFGVAPCQLTRLSPCACRVPASAGRSRAGTAAMRTAGRTAAHTAAQARHRRAAGVTVRRPCRQRTCWAARMESWTPCARPAVRRGVGTAPGGHGICGLVLFKCHAGSAAPHACRTGPGPAGLRLAPDAEDLRRFVEGVSSLDGLRVAELLRARMVRPGDRSGAAWRLGGAGTGRRSRDRSVGVACRALQSQVRPVPISPHTALTGPRATC